MILNRVTYNRPYADPDFTWAERFNQPDYTPVITPIQISASNVESSQPLHNGFTEVTLKTDEDTQKITVKETPVEVDTAKRSELRVLAQAKPAQKMPAGIELG